MAYMRERVRKDGSIAYNVVWPDIDGGGPKKSRTFTIKAEADELLEFLNANGNSFRMAAQGVLAKRSRAPTVHAVILSHIDRLGGEVEPGTLHSYRGMAKNHFADSPIGRTPIDTLTSNQVRAWFDSHPRSPKTKKNIHALLSAALSRAVDDGFIDTNPARGVRGPKTYRKSRRPVFLTRQEASNLVAEMPCEFQIFVRLLLGTGLRFGEATALQREDAQRAGGRLGVRVTEAWKRHGGRGVGTVRGGPKTKAGSRFVTLSQADASALEDHMRAVPRGELLFRHPATGGRILNSTFHMYVWQPAISKLLESGRLVERPTVHDLRHTHASWLIEKGVPLPVIQARLGHESIQTTIGTYGHLAVDADARAADALDGSFR